MFPIRNLLVLYGSQTGTAKEVAEDIEREASRRLFNVTLRNILHFDVVLFHSF